MGSPRPLVENLYLVILEEGLPLGDQHSTEHDPLQRLVPLEVGPLGGKYDRPSGVHRYLANDLGEVFERRVDSQQLLRPPVLAERIILTRPEAGEAGIDR